MSCIHIQGTQREGVDVPLVFKSPPVTKRTIKRLWKLGESNDPLIRASAGASHNAPSALLSRLAMDNSESVRISVARNTTTPDHVLWLLSQDVSMRVRGFVALNRNTTDVVLRLLSKDRSEGVSNLADFMLKSGNLE